MFNADLSWRDAGAEMVGERRRRIALEMAITTETSSPSLDVPRHEVISSARTSLSQQSTSSWKAKLKSRFNLIRAGKPLSTLRTSLEPLHRLERIPTLMQQADHSPIKTMTSPFDKPAQASTMDIEEGSRTRAALDENHPYLPKEMQVHKDIQSEKANSFSNLEISPEKRDEQPEISESENATYGPAYNLQCVEGKETAQEQGGKHTQSELVNSDSGYDSLHNLSSWNDGAREIHDNAANDTLVRAVRQMYATTKEILFHHLQVKQTAGQDDLVQEDAQLERLLWSIVAAERPFLDRFTIYERSVSFWSTRERELYKPGNSLNIEGSTAEIYCAASLMPKRRLVHLSIRRRQEILEASFPSTVTRQQTRDLEAAAHGPSVLMGTFAARLLRLPYDGGSFDGISATRIATLLPVQSLLPFLRDCHRVLKSGGILQLRMIDAIPAVRGTVGPRLSSWLKDCLLVNLAKEMRCQHSCQTLPLKAIEAGFSPVRACGQDAVRRLRLPAAVSSHDDAVSKMASVVVQELWKETWAEHVSAVSKEHSWWWQDVAIIKECVEWQTSWDLSWYYFVKQ